MSCGKGYEMICMAHDVCRLGKSIEEAGAGVARKTKNEIIIEWLNRGLIKRDGERYDASELCKRYEEYVECVKSGGKPIWSCFKSTLGGR